jgi:hypothetical protein
MVDCPHDQVHLAHPRVPTEFYLDRVVGRALDSLIDERAVIGYRLRKVFCQSHPYRSCIFAARDSGCWPTVKFSA